MGRPRIAVLMSNSSSSLCPVRRAYSWYADQDESNDSRLDLIPFARGGYKNLYAPLDFDAGAMKLALLGVASKPELKKELDCSDAHVEAEVIDNQGGTLVTLVNWANEPAEGVKVTLTLPFKPSSAKLISAGKAMPLTYENGAAVFTLDIAQAEFVLLNK